MPPTPPRVGEDAFAFYPGGQADGNAPLGATVYCLSGTTGWSDTFAGLPTVMLDGPPQFGATTDGWSYVSDQVANAIITGYSGASNAVVIPSLINGVPITGIGREALAYNGNLTSLIVPSSVTNIGYEAFLNCDSLTSVYFSGNAPSVDPSAFGNDNYGIDPTTVFYLPGTLGWDTFSYYFAVPTALWLPQAQTGDGNFGVRSNQFGFNIAWASGQTVVVEACTNLRNPVWSPVTTNTLTGDSSYFTDPQPANLPGRYYRLRSL